MSSLCPIYSSFTQSPPHSSAVLQSPKYFPFLYHLAIALEPTLIHLLCPLIQFCFPFLDWFLPFQSVTLSLIPALMPSYSIYFSLIFPIFYHWFHSHSSSHIPSSSLPQTPHLSLSGWSPPVSLTNIFVLTVISHSPLSSLELGRHSPND